MSKLVLLSVQGNEASLLLLFICLFWVISPPLSCNSKLVLGGGLCGFHSLVHNLPFLSFGDSFVGGFSLPAGILVFIAPTYFFM